MELQGLPEGGKRKKVQNLLPRYADKATVGLYTLHAVDA
jgi:hypothetical protein